MQRSTLVTVLVLVGVGIIIGYILFSPTTGVPPTVLYPTVGPAAPANPPAAPARPTPAVSEPRSGGAPRLGSRTKESGCVARGGLPDPACTPGARLDVTVQDICTPGYARSVRNVPESEKEAVYAAYGIASHRPGQYEVDHLISLELGGSNAQANLWPEPAEPRPGFHEKDRVEDFLHEEVCAGRMSLGAAQELIATDWFAVYKKLP